MPFLAMAGSEFVEVIGGGPPDHVSGARSFCSGRVASGSRGHGGNGALTFWGAVVWGVQEGVGRHTCRVRLLGFPREQGPCP